jgi:hypothetical protein
MSRVQSTRLSHDSSLPALAGRWAAAFLNFPGALSAA